jgi:hypothetical protein
VPAALERVQPVGAFTASLTSKLPLLQMPIAVTGPGPAASITAAMSAA